MNREEFIIFIESIGFRYNGFYYDYKEFRIGLNFHLDEYYFDNGSEYKVYSYNDLAPDLLKLVRSIKLKSLLR